MTHVDALVVGAGVCGLTTAISLAEAGLTTRIQAASPPPQTTSVAAGAIWGPVRCGPADRTREWARVGLEVLSALADEPAAAIRQVSGREVAEAPAEPPEWMDLLRFPVGKDQPGSPVGKDQPGSPVGKDQPAGVRMCAPSELPDGFASGWRYTAPVLTMPLYLDYLRARYEAAGGSIEISPVTSLSSLDAPVVVNCTGIGARDLVPDPLVVPVRGQVVVVRNPGIEEFYIDHGEHGTDYVYLFPHGDVVLLGGTAEEDAWDLAARPSVSERILRDCAAVFPRLRGAEVVAHRVGLRPCRPAVRLEAEPLPGSGSRVLWHNYGHGGGGVTLSWGCAREITAGVLAGAASA